MEISKLKTLTTPNLNDVLPILDINGGLSGKPVLRKATLASLLALAHSGDNSNNSPNFAIPTTIRTFADFDDYFIGIGDNGTTYKITKSDLLQGLLNSSGVGSSNLGNPAFDTIIHKDSNWNLATRVNQYGSRQTSMWTSFGVDGSGADSLTGILKIGYLSLKSKLHILIAGGGSTSPTLKTVKFCRKSDNAVLLNLSMGQILGVDTNDLLHRTIDTSSISGNEVYLQLEDNATDAYGWIAFSPNIFME
jgi:hypothetical protein